MADAIRARTRVDIPGSDQTKLAIYKWTGLDSDDSGDPVQVPHGADITVQVYGTFGAGGSLSIQGAAEIVSPTYAILNDSRGEGNAMTFTAADIRQLQEAPVLLRPIVTAGDGTTSLTCLITVRRP